MNILKQDKQVKAVNSQNNTENNIVNEIESSSDEEDNKSDLQIHYIAVDNRKNHPYPILVIKPNQIINFKDSHDIECIGRVLSRAGKARFKCGHRNCCKVLDLKEHCQGH